MTIEEFTDRMEREAAQLDCPLSPEAGSLLRRLLERYRHKWVPGEEHQETLTIRRRVWVTVLRAVLTARRELTSGAKETSVSGAAFARACADHHHFDDDAQTAK